VIQGEAEDAIRAEVVSEGLRKTTEEVIDVVDACTQELE
jgi:hypothetical protein